MTKYVVGFVISLLLISFTYAEKMSAAIFKNPNGSNELVTTNDAACIKPIGNATYASGNKKIEACWSREGEQVKLEMIDGSGVKSFPASEFTLITEIANQQSDNSNKPSKNHLTCFADGMSTQIDIERDEIGKLRKVFVEGDEVFPVDKYTKINFTYDGYDFSINSLNGTFTYESTGVSSYLKKMITKSKAKGVGDCKITELVRKF